MSSLTSNSTESFKYLPENVKLFILHVPVNIYAERKNLIFNQALIDLFIILPSGNGWITMQN